MKLQSVYSLLLVVSAIAIALPVGATEAEISIPPTPLKKGGNLLSPTSQNTAEGTVLSLTPLLKGGAAGGGISGFMAQQSSITQVTAVRLQQTDKGLEVILETAEGELLQVFPAGFGKTFVANIPNAQLADGKTFRQENPASGIASIAVMQQGTNNIRVTVTGTRDLPLVEVGKSDASGGLRQRALTLTLLDALAPTAQQPAPPAPAAPTPETQTTPEATPPQAEVPSTEGEAQQPITTEGEEQEIVVTGEQETRYSVPSATTATKTDTPLRDIPQSIQVIPQEVIQDQQATRIEEVLRNVSGVTFQGNDDNRGAGFSLRGFENAPILRDGFRLYSNYSNQGSPETANLERVEVLKGPASVLYGEIEPGGLINLVSKQPLNAPFYQAELQIGSRELVRPRIDISGPLTTDGNVLYRLNALYQHRESFRDYDTDAERFFAAPTLTWKISDRTDLTLALEYLDDSSFADFGTIASGNSVADIPASRVTNNPDDTVTNNYFSVGYNFEHRFNDNWTLRNAFRYQYFSYDYSVLALPFEFDEAATLTRFFADQDSEARDYTLQTNLVGKLNTGSIKHTFLLGIDLNRSERNVFTALGDPSPLDIFNPIYDQAEPDTDTLPVFSDITNEANRLGVYVQDQVALLDNLFFLAGLRYDTIDQEVTNAPTAEDEGSEQNQTEDAFTPRIGVVYQPIEEVSLYASYSRSFRPNDSTSASGDFLQPEEGEGYEIGVKTEWLEGKLSATLAYFDITKQNVAVEDPAFPGLGFSIATGEQRSRGFELDAVGEILPGWNMLASYAYIDAEVTEDTPDLVGSRLTGIPKHSASLWTTYEIQKGNLQGLGFGIGFNYVGEREGGLPNSFQADSFFLTNAAIFYRRNNWRFALNFKNLFDIDYIDAVGDSRIRGIYPGEPFTVIGSVSVEF